MTACECKDPYHEGKPCNQTDESVQDWAPGVIVSPVLCMRCLFVCEEFDGGNH